MSMDLVDLSVEMDVDGPARNSDRNRVGWIFQPANEILRKHAHAEIWGPEIDPPFRKGRPYEMRVQSELDPTAHESARLLVARYAFVVQRDVEREGWGGDEVVLDPVDDRLTGNSFVLLYFENRLKEWDMAERSDENLVEIRRFTSESKPPFRSNESIIVSFLDVDD